MRYRLKMCMESPYILSPKDGQIAKALEWVKKNLSKQNLCLYSLVNMEHNSKSSQSTSTSVSVPKIEKDGYLLEGATNSYTIVTNIIFPDEFNESSLFSDLHPKFLFGKKNTSYSTEENSYSSRVSESGRSELDQTLAKNVLFTDVFGDKEEQLKQRLSFGGVEIDNVFHPSDVGKEILLKDQEAYEREFTMNGATCSSWSICTRKTLLDTSLLDENGQCDTVGEYMRKMSGPLGDISGKVCCNKVYFGFDASTPKPDSKEFLEIESLQNEHKTPAYVPFYGGISNSNFPSQNESTSPIKTKVLSSMLLYSVKKRASYGSIDYRHCISPKTYENIQRLEEAEKRKCFNSVEQLPFTLNCSYNSTERSFGILHQNDTTIKVDTSGTSIEIAQGESSVTEKWIVQPQELTLDINSKGFRISLMNCSKKDLKFKTKFDCKITNVCPISGILPANGEIGLRILVSRYIKNRFEHETEDAIIITCGKKEKAIQVKICKNSQQRSLKERSYICF